VSIQGIRSIDGVYRLRIRTVEVRKLLRLFKKFALNSCGTESSYPVRLNFGVCDAVYGSDFLERVHKATAHKIATSDS
jgi:hypothetical protein